MKVQDEYRITSYGDLLKRIKDPDLSKIRDFTDNGKCRDCGNCCVNMLPLTSGDYKRIMEYIKANDVKPARPRILQGPFAKPTAHNLCPFLLDQDEHRCSIYPVRPGICRKYTCHNPGKNQELINWYLSVPYIKTVDMYIMFYPEETMKELGGLIDNI